MISFPHDRIPADLTVKPCLKRVADAACRRRRQHGKGRQGSESGISRIASVYRS